MKLSIRPEIEEDYPAVKVIADLAFGHNSEGILVERLRRFPDFVPCLSIVAESEDKIIGHILFYPVKINGGNIKHETLSLAPMCVHPAYQKSGVGTALVTEGLARAKETGYGSVIVLGHPEYYPRFGFKKASVFGIRSPFAATDNVFFALELIDQALSGISGIVEYPEPFLKA